jgi:hypothetical protein
MTDTQPGTPIAWRAVTYGTPVFSADGQAAGTVLEVLGSDAEDIFHGVRVGLSQSHRQVVVPAADVTGLTDARVDTGLSLAAIQTLPAYTEEATFHLASVGWLRKHIGWKKDSGSDEEPG